MDTTVILKDIEGAPFPLDVSSLYSVLGCHGVADGKKVDPYIDIVIDGQAHRVFQGSMDLYEESWLAVDSVISTKRLALLSPFFDPIHKTDTSDFECRQRMTLTEANQYLLNSQSNMIAHLLDNGDGTYSLLYHIVCEHCDYCYTQGDCRGRGDAVPQLAKLLPYEMSDPERYLPFGVDIDKLWEEIKGMPE